MNISGLFNKDWTHFGEISKRLAANVDGQSIVANTVTTLDLDTELLNTGNKVVVNGDNTFTLQPGTYEFDYNVALRIGGINAAATIRLWNDTDSNLVTSKLFVDAYDGVGTTWQNLGLRGYISISSPKTFKIDTICGDISETGHRNVGSELETSDLVDISSFQFKWRSN